MTIELSPMVSIPIRIDHLCEEGRNPRVGGRHRSWRQAFTGSRVDRDHALDWPVGSQRGRRIGPQDGSARVTRNDVGEVARGVVAKRADDCTVFTNERVAAIHAGYTELTIPAFETTIAQDGLTTVPVGRVAPTVRVCPRDRD